ncbi:uncharacterized protein IL334_003354 [Kwoniella shivajii]|uniref:NAD binding dehydrogenase n=1 Tax=Kwoniella shivajii TaxID=564305 RepID=A0ABZ1CXC3_9TREE|nr:hypothetical protein IL334_003354 [Kwoniella shivajii]
MTSKFNVLLLGAGPINFGTTEGPWNHSKRLEQHLGQRLNVVGLIDMNKERAESVLTIKRADASVKAGYENTKVFTSLKEAGEALKGDEVPHLAIIGFQPTSRGSTKPDHDNELELIRLFPKVGLFVEKPLSDISDFKDVEEVGRRLKENGNVTSVGYMLRYLKAAQEIKKIIDENKLTVMHTQASYLFAYDFAAKDFYGYWSKAREPGPIVTQATHICDLTRYLTPPVLLDSVHTNTVEHTDPAGNLSILRFDEKGLVKPEDRIPRVTSSTWRYENGATGSLLHAVVLHEGDYDCELMILADGWKFRLVDPYGISPRLYIRKPGTTEEVRTIFTDDDCYLSEIEAIIDVIDGKSDNSVILSPYEDSIKTYEFTWAIRLAGERAFQARGGVNIKK